MVLIKIKKCECCKKDLPRHIRGNRQYCDNCQRYIIDIRRKYIRKINYYKNKVIKLSLIIASTIR